MISTRVAPRSHGNSILEYLLRLGFDGYNMLITQKQRNIIMQDLIVMLANKTNIIRCDFPPSGSSKKENTFNYDG